MTKLLFASFALALATPAFADAPAEWTFTRDGASYVYTAREDGGLMIIEGRNRTTGEPFSLTVRNGRVDGTYDRKAVSFVVPPKSGRSVIAAR